MRRLPFAFALLVACHAPPPAPAPSVPGITVHVAAADGVHATHGTLFATWLTADEAATFQSGGPSMMTLRDMVTRGVVAGDVDVAHGAVATVHPATGRDVVVAVLDVSGVGVSSMLGEGDGTLLGFSAPFDVTGAAADAPPVALGPMPAPAPPPERCSGERITLEHIDAPEVAGTVGNPTSRRLCVRVPDGYAAHPEKRYPVIYILPGLLSDDQAAMSYGIDEPDTIEVAVDTSTRTGSTYLADSPTSGNWDTFFTRDLIPFVDAHYRTLPGRAARALIGHSTGGFNAMSYGLRHPDLIGVIGASSPDGLDLRAWLADGDAPRPWIRDWARVEHGFGGAGQFISYAADWSPTPGGYAWPFDDRGGFVPDVLARWLAHSPAEILRDPKGADARKALSGDIYLTVGDADEFELDRPTKAFDQELTAAGIAHQLVITHGGHVTHETDQLAAAAAFCASHLEAAR